MDYPDEKREYARVDAYLPFEVRLISPQDREAHIPRISGVAVLKDYAKPPDLEDKLLSQWLTMINAKLDSIISSLSVEREGFSALTFKTLIISGSGMSFNSKERYSKGDFLEIKILLYMYPHVALYVYGDVVNIEQGLDSFNIAVRFTGMSDDIRDEIVKFVFRRQREILSMKRG
jgi:hypothetical protein